MCLCVAFSVSHARGFKEDFRALAQDQQLPQQALDDFFTFMDAHAQELLKNVEQRRLVCLQVVHEEELEELEVRRD